MKPFRIEVRYTYSPEAKGKKKNAIVSVILPTCGKWLHKMYVNPDVELLGAPLTPKWGAPHQDGRVCKRFIVGETWADVQEQVEKLVRQVKDTVMQVVKKNVEAIQGKPKDYVLVIDPKELFS